MKRTQGLGILVCTSALLSVTFLGACQAEPPSREQSSDSGDPWIAGFLSSAHHWNDRGDDDLVFLPVQGQSRYPVSDVVNVAENVLLYQNNNGGWPKNYDMWAVLTKDQVAALEQAKGTTNTTFDNGATHSQVHFLAHAYRETGDTCYRDACLRGLDFILQAQYENGGWPQSFPDRSGYRRHITFNDGAMIGILSVLKRTVDGDREFTFVDDIRRGQVRDAYRRGLECILRCQIVEKGRPKVWCQQHDEEDFSPRGARTFELAALASEESAEIVSFLMSLNAPDTAVIRAVSSAVQWFDDAALSGIRVETVEAPSADYRYHASREDKVVVRDPDAPRIWARYYELETGVPLFSNRDGRPVYSLAEVERERRTGYAWYSYTPQGVLKAYPLWIERSTPASGLPKGTPEQGKR